MVFITLVGKVLPIISDISSFISSNENLNCNAPGATAHIEKR